MRELGGEQPAPVVDPVVTVSAEGFLPEDYVPDVNQRPAFYKRLAASFRDEEIAELRAELADRFGPLPEEAEQRLDIVRIRVAARGRRQGGSGRGAAR